MMLTLVNQNGLVAIPTKPLRELNIKDGDYLKIELRDRGIFLCPPSPEDSKRV